MATDKLTQDLRRFAEDHPQGWGHHEWLGLLDSLSQSGHDVTDQDGVGRELERERLRYTLQRMEMKGLGPKRIEALASHFGTLYNLMNASAAEVAQVPNIPSSLAGQILDTLQ